MKSPQKRMGIAVLTEIDKKSQMPLATYMLQEYLGPKYDPSFVMDYYSDVHNFYWKEPSAKFPFCATTHFVSL